MKGWFRIRKYKGSRLRWITIVQLIVLLSIMFTITAKETPAGSMNASRYQSLQLQQVLVNWTNYHDYNEIMDVIFSLNDSQPQFVDVFPIGKSWRNQTVYCVRLTNEEIKDFKPQTLYVGYHHAGERISAELPLYFIVHAVENYGLDSAITRMLDLTETYIVVALNVDGFEEFQQNEWHRKNAHPCDEDDDGVFDEDQPDDVNSNGIIEDLVEWNGTEWVFVRWEGVDDDEDGLFNEDWAGGVDLNRNYGFEWDATCISGSQDPQAQDYRGSMPFSEPETRAIRDLALQHDFRYSVSFHSGAEYIVYPWGYTQQTTQDDDAFLNIVEEMAQVVGCEYEQSGSWYTTSGTWGDWMYGNRSSMALTCEIYTNDTAWQYEPISGSNRSWERGVFEFFNPNPEHIEETCQRWVPIFTLISERAIESSSFKIGWETLVVIAIVLVGISIALVLVLWRRRTDLPTL